MAIGKEKEHVAGRAAGGGPDMTLYIKITAYCSIEESKSEAVKTAAQVFITACESNGVALTRADITATLIEGSVPPDVPEAESARGARR